jgi:hypothetical protein
VLEQKFLGADPHALRRALEALKKRPRPDAAEQQ